MADELGLFSDQVQRLGMTALRAVRLVVDTGLRARPWLEPGAGVGVRAGAHPDA